MQLHVPGSTARARHQRRWWRHARAAHAARMLPAPTSAASWRACPVGTGSQGPARAAGCGTAATAAAAAPQRPDPRCSAGGAPAC
eukprot:scaffold96286_cov15-Tisochrysis_lutea.AAC.2